MILEKLKSLKGILKVPSNGCNRMDCYQGRNCSCVPKEYIQFSDTIIAIHTLSSKIDDPEISREIRILADKLARIGNEYHDKYGT